VSTSVRIVDDDILSADFAGADDVFLRKESRFHLVDRDSTIQKKEFLTCASSCWLGYLFVVGPTTSGAVVSKNLRMLAALAL
jgi:hypothetical protein